MEQTEETLRALIIEDNENDYLLITRAISKANGFSLVPKRVANEKEIRQALTDETWDLIVCDYFLLGYDAPRVKALMEYLGIDVPFVLVSGHISQEVADMALKLGAHEYVSKDELWMLGPVIHRELKLFRAYDENLKAWGQILEIRDFETQGHSERVVDLSVRLAARMGVTAPNLVHIRRGAYLHDIGKLAISDDVLLKKGPLTDAEMTVMKGHPVIAYELVRNQEFLKKILEIPLLHHERWNGTGYPYGLQGDRIPLPARIFAVVDVYDALTNHRPYRDAMEKDVALAYIKSEAGITFDPEVVKKFVELVGRG